MNSGELKSTLSSLLASKVSSNAALTALLDDYARYHAVLVLLGSVLALGLMVLSACCWSRLKRSVRARGWTFEAKVNASFGVLGVLTGLLMTLLVWANASNALNPRAGFAGVVNILGHAQTGSVQAQRYRAFDAWLRSGRAAVPALVNGKIQRRLAWQAPKAIVSGLLLVVFVALGLRIWPHLVRTSRLNTAWTLGARGLWVVGVATVPCGLLLMLMLIGNAQASFAPLTITMLYG